MTSRGGARVAKGGQANRADLLNSAARQPITAAPGQPYGEAGQQIAAQHQVPMGTPAPPAPTPGPPPAAAPAGGPGDLASILGRLRPLTAPTRTPQTPVTNGLPTGPGAGPEALQQFTPDPMAQAAAQLGSIPAVHQTPMLKAILAATRASVDNASNPNIAQGPPQ